MDLEDRTGDTSAKRASRHPQSCEQRTRDSLVPGDPKITLQTHAHSRHKNTFKNAQLRVLSTFGRFLVAGDPTFTRS